MHLAQFLGDTPHQAGGAKSSSSDSSPEAINCKFRGLDKEARDLMVDLNLSYSSYKPLHEVEVTSSALNEAMENLDSFVDTQVDSSQDLSAREAVLRH